jgi:hypothetical protein
MLELEYFMWLEHAVTYDPGLGNGRAGVGSGFHRWHSLGAIGCPSMPIYYIMKTHITSSPVQTQIHYATEVSSQFSVPWLCLLIWL